LSDKLIKRLRGPMCPSCDEYRTPQEMLEAADRIEALERALRDMLLATGEGPRHDAACAKAHALLTPSAAPERQ
jgi:pyruvate/2-oxoacid:ferredoxin oxidoreductase beta subunit